MNFKRRYVLKNTKQIIMFLIINILLLVIFIDKGITEFGITAILFISCLILIDHLHHSNIEQDEIYNNTDNWVTCKLDEYNLKLPIIKSGSELSIKPCYTNNVLYIPRNDYDLNMLTHEIGHLKQYDNKIIVAFLRTLSIYSLIIIPSIFNVLLIKSMNQSVNIIILLLLVIIFTIIIEFLIKFLDAYFRRKMEYKADLFAAKQVGKKEYLKSLKNIDSVQNKIKDDKYYIINVLFNYLKTHPNPDERKQFISDK